MRPEPPVRADYVAFRPITTRWMDNDVYGHVNNVVYYSFFDTVVNGHLVDAGVLDFQHGETVGFVVETGCSYFAPVAFPDALTGGVRVECFGTSSVPLRGRHLSKGEERSICRGPLRPRLCRPGDAPPAATAGKASERPGSALYRAGGRWGRTWMRVFLSSTYLDLVEYRTSQRRERRHSHSALPIASMSS